MRINDMYEAFNAGRLEKRLFIEMSREKNVTLYEFVELLRNTNKKKSISITADGIILDNNGLKYYFDLSQTFSRAESDLVMGDDYEQGYFDYISSFIEEGDVVLDVGGNVGIFSLNMANLVKGCTVYTFEPLQSTFKKMNQNLLLNSELAKSIYPYNIGISDSIGETVFYLPGEDEAASMRPLNDDFYFMKCDENGRWSGKEDPLEIKCKIDTVDNFCKNKSISCVKIIKLDIEGAELFALRGAEEILLRDKPIVYCEMLRKHARRFGYHPNDIIDFMKKIDYDCFVLNNGNLEKFNMMTEDTTDTNFIFMHNAT